MQHAYSEMKCVQCRRDPVFRVGSALTAERIFRLHGLGGFGGRLIVRATAPEAATAH
jgi:hypothetical protein